MPDSFIEGVKEKLAEVFNNTYEWFVVNDEILNYHPLDGGWNIREILEHISLTNHYLLILIRKATIKSLEMAGKQTVISFPEGYEIDNNKLRKIGEHGSFEWHRPEHMQPGGDADLKAVQDTLNSQLIDCINLLSALKNGEGVLYKTMMSVNELGKIDVYHYICFLAEHMRRHLTQMRKVKEEYELKNEM